MKSNMRSTITSWSIDELEQVMIDAEHEIARQRARQIVALEILDRVQVATADGCKSLSEWAAQRLDLHPDTARSLVRTMRRTSDRPDLREALATGEVSFDRVEAASRVDGPGPDPLFEHLDIAGVQREAARRSRINADQESRSWTDRFLVLQPSLDESWWKLWGGLDGVSGAIVDKALSESADALPVDPETPTDSAWRRATALTQLRISDTPPPVQVTVFVDTGHATPTNGEAGVTLEAGPRVGRQALEALLCESVSDVIVKAEDGTPLRYGRTSRSIPPALRRAVLHRDGNRCVIDGCDSRNRLQIHHITPWNRGGTTDPENLVTLCWYHHQIAIHQQHLDLYQHPTHHRWRLRRTGPDRGPPG